MATIASVGGAKETPPAVQAQQDLQAKRDEVHLEERNKFLIKTTGTGLLGQKIGGMGGKIDISA